MPCIENCTADPRNLSAPMPTGMRAALSLAPGEISKELDQATIDVLRSNSAVELLFKHRLLRITTKAPETKAEAPKVETHVADTPKKKGKFGKGKNNLDLGV